MEMTELEKFKLELSTIFHNRIQAKIVGERMMFILNLN